MRRLLEHASSCEPHREGKKAASKALLGCYACDVHFGNNHALYKHLCDHAKDPTINECPQCGFKGAKRGRCEEKGYFYSDFMLHFPLSKPSLFKIELWKMSSPVCLIFQSQKNICETRLKRHLLNELPVIGVWPCRPYLLKFFLPLSSCP